MMSCVNGVSCTINGCTGGTGDPLACLSMCFNGDVRQIVTGIDAVQCVYARCGSQCVGGVNVESPLSLDQ
jgi:hypothetical protein